MIFLQDGIQKQQHVPGFQPLFVFTFNTGLRKLRLVLFIFHPFRTFPKTHKICIQNYISTTIDKIKKNYTPIDICTSSFNALMVQSLYYYSFFRTNFSPPTIIVFESILWIIVSPNLSEKGK